MAMPLSSRIFPNLFGSHFKVSGLLLSSLIHLQWIFVQCGWKGSSFGLLYVDIQFSQHYFLKRLFFSPIYFFHHFVKNQMSVVVWFYFWVFYSVPFVFVSVSVSIPCHFVTMGLQQTLNSGVGYLQHCSFCSR
jgi:hypothetical protein